MIEQQTDNLAKSLITIHPFFCLLHGLQSRWQQAMQGPSHPQLILGDTKALTGIWNKLQYKPSSMFGVCTGVSSELDVLGIRDGSMKHPDQMPKLPSLSPFSANVLHLPYYFPPTYCFCGPSVCLSSSRDPRNP